MTANDMDRI